MNVSLKKKAAVALFEPSLATALKFRIDQVPDQEVPPLKAGHPSFITYFFFEIKNFACDFSSQLS